MNKVKLSAIILAGLFLVKCGDPTMEIEDQYEPKIVVEAVLTPGQTLEGVMLSRNFKLGGKLDPTDIILTPVGNQVSAEINGQPLQYDQNSFSYGNSSVTVDYNTAYTLTVTAVIDGKQLTTEATTVTPKNGFDIVDDSLGTIKYGEEKIMLRFLPSPDSDFYVFSYKPDSTSADNFIYDNPYFPDIEPEDVEEGMNAWAVQYNMMDNLNSYRTDPFEFEIRGLDVWFYTSYRVIGYAGDENFKNYFITAPNVMEFDGNFHEPIMSFKGDGIGLFGSAVADTLYFKLVK